MGVLDCSDYKSALRIKHRNYRKLMNKEEKSVKDFQIFQKFISYDLFSKSDVILTYVSNDIEVDTRKIIEYSLSVGKKVAVPVSIKDNFSLNFYFIHSMNDLHVGYFSILEPNIDTCKLCKINKLKNYLCVVPGLVFDVCGYRVGYGKGYYDRFLKKYKSETVGLCYEIDLVKSIHKNQYDVSVDAILTENLTLKVDETKGLKHEI